MPRPLPTLLSLLLLAACAAAEPPAPVERTREVRAPAETVADRLRTALPGLGLGDVTPAEGGGLAARSGSSPAAWMDCPIAMIGSDGRRDIAVPEARSATVRIGLVPEGEGTRITVEPSFTGHYRNRFVNVAFTRACSSTGELERRLLDAAAAT
ncbi:MAG TPA: hypothetical protein VFG43_08410 [Geminicoccaceae bacterium]|nr:hypothetical protein [Geminicoccaceae bacterium]